MRLQDEDVGEIREGDVVRHEPGEADEMHGGAVERGALPWFCCQ